LRDLPPAHHTPGSDDIHKGHASRAASAIPAGINFALRAFVPQNRDHSNRCFAYSGNLISFNVCTVLIDTRVICGKASPDSLRLQLLK
jgi:hypothetical protein